MHDNQVVLLFKEMGIARRTGEVGLLFGRTEIVLGALQAVVDGFGHREEGVVAGDQFPVGQKPQVAQQRHFGAQDFRHPAAVGGGVEVQDAGTVQWLG